MTELNDLHGSGMRLLNTKKEVQLAINRNLKETGTIIPRSLTRLEPESTSYDHLLNLEA